MKKFSYFVAGILISSATQAFIPPAHAWMSLEDGLKRDRALYQKYVECRDKNPKVVTYECLRLNPLGFQQL